MNKMKNQIRRARKAGMSNLDILRIKETAKKAADKLESEAVEKAFLYMLAIPLNVLVHDYWSKTANKKAPKFIDDVISLFESVQAGVVTDKELADLLKDMADVSIDAEWLKNR